MPRPLQAVIDMAALASNHAMARALAPRARVLATIKANGYGHGLPRVERALADADGFAVCEIDQAAALRERARAARRERPVLLLESHLDTVAHPRVPIPVRREQGRLYGRGACDTKGSGAAMIAAERILAR